MASCCHYEEADYGNGKACMHILRITYLPAYRSMVRHPYTCDPLHVSPARLNSPVGVNEHRELLALDHFIVLLGKLTSSYGIWQISNCHESL